MAYETGTASGPTNLLQKLVTFLISYGWIEDMSQSDGTGWRAHLHRGDIYVNLKTTIGAVNPWGYSVSPSPGSGSAALHIYVGSGFSSGSNWNAQPGGPIAHSQSYRFGHSMPLPQGGITGYHFFSDGNNDNIVVVVEKTPGIFTHIGWGVSIIKAGTFVGGEYFFGAIHGYGFASTSTTGAGAQNGITANSPFCSSDGVTSAPSGYIRVDVDSFVDKWIGIGQSTSVPSGGYTGWRGNAGYRGIGGSAPVAEIPSDEWYVERLVPAMTGAATLLPIRVYVDRAIGGDSLLGTIPSIYHSWATRAGYTAPVEIQVGPDSYMIFPNFAVRKVS